MVTCASRRRQAFTIVELLVVITIIGILIALTIPAVNIAREAARRGNCINNQRQVALGVIGYSTRKGSIPSHLGDSSTGSGVSWPWVARVMRDIGRGDIADAMANTPALTNYTQRIDILICPSDPPADAAAPSLSYVANAGQSGVDDAIHNGVFFKTNKQDLSYITQGDGTSTTLMLSENVNVANWNDAGGEINTAIIWPIATGINKDLSAALSASTARPSSRHPGGFVGAFCDGTARFLSQEMATGVYDKIMTSKGALCSPAQSPLSATDLD